MEKDLFINDFSVNDEVLEICEESNYLLYELKETNQFFITKPIMDSSFLPKKRNVLNKPNFSYYPSIKELHFLKNDDDRLKKFPNQQLLFQFEGREIDSEVLLFNPGLDFRSAKMIFNIFTNQENEFQSIFEVVENLENIFGLIWKVNKKIQVGLYGELLFIKENIQYEKQLLTGFHRDEFSGKDFESLTDFQIETSLGNLKTLEIKTSTSDEGLFTLKNNQMSETINDYMAAIAIKIVKKGGQTLIDLIDWYLSKSQGLNDSLMKSLIDIKKNHDVRGLLRFDTNNFTIKIIKISDIPYISNYDIRIKNIAYQVDLNNFDGVSLEDIMNEKNDVI